MEFPVDRKVVTDGRRNTICSTDGSDFEKMYKIY